MDCLFCRIVAGEIPSTKLYEDDLVLAFRDIDPKAPQHIVIIPKAHIESCREIDAAHGAAVARIFEAVAQLTRDPAFADGFRVVANTGPAAGQSVPHLHFHLLAGRQFAWPPG